MAEGSKDLVCFVLAIAVWLQGDHLWLCILIQLIHLFPWEFSKCDELELKMCLLPARTECGKYSMSLNIQLRFWILANPCSGKGVFLFKYTQFPCRDVSLIDSEAFCKMTKFYLHYIDMEAIQAKMICLVFQTLRMEPDFF